MIAVGQTNRVVEAGNWILVLSATNIPHTLKAEHQQYTLLVPEQYQLKAEYQLQKYVEENRNWPPQKPAADRFAPKFQLFSTLLFGLLAGFYLITGSWNEQSNWFTYGAGNSADILYNHQWYKIITPLTLHADNVHLIGNCLIGGVLLHFLCKSTGNGLALFLTLASAVVANYVNVLVHGSGHIFVGYSTAVFATIGLLTSLQIQLYKRASFSPLRIITPFMAGLGLLAIFGSSGERTDLGAHFFGLLSGTAMGLLFSKALLQYRSKIMVQFCSFALSAIILIGSWIVAFKTLPTP